MNDQQYGTGEGPPQASTSAPTVPRSPRRGGIGLGVVLIALGVLFLLVQFVPGISLWQMWPLFIILLGGLQIVTPDPRDGWGISRVLDGVGTVIVGLVLLGNTTGYISWGVWWTLLTLWPVFLIAIGLSILARAVEQSWLRMLAPVVIWLAFAYAVAASFTGAGGMQPLVPLVAPAGQAFDLSQPVRDVRSATLTLDGGAGDITMGSSATGDLISAHGSSPFGTPDFNVTSDGANATVRFGIGNHRGFVIGPGFTAGKVDVRLSSNVLWDATLQTGATSLSADLTKVRVRDLTLKTGASSVDMRLGPVPDGIAKSTVVVKAGVSSVQITLPRGAEARVVAQSGLSAIDVGGDFKRQGDGSWQTPGYSSARSAYDIDIESGVGSVSIRQN